MAKPDNYYYTDSRYQLELNLQLIRQELIDMIEDFENKDCTACKQLKCRCSESKLIPDSERNNRATKSSHGNQNLDSKEAPPADFLPKPKWDEVKDEAPASSTPKKSTNTEAGIKSVTATASPNVTEYNRARTHDSGVPAVWTRLKSAWEKETSLERPGSINGVEAFFRSFKNPSLPHSSAQTNVSYVSNTLAAACKITPKKPFDYKYF